MCLLTGYSSAYGARDGETITCQPPHNLKQLMPKSRITTKRRFIAGDKVQVHPAHFPERHSSGPASSPDDDAPESRTPAGAFNHPPQLTSSLAVPCEAQSASRRADSGRSLADGHQAVGRILAPGGRRSRQPALATRLPPKPKRRARHRSRGLPESPSGDNSSSSLRRTPDRPRCNPRRFRPACRTRDKRSGRSQSDSSGSPRSVRAPARTGTECSRSPALEQAILARTRHAAPTVR